MEGQQPQTWPRSLTAISQTYKTLNALRMLPGEVADFPARAGQSRSLEGGARQERRQRGKDSSL